MVSERYSVTLCFRQGCIPHAIIAGGDGSIDGWAESVPAAFDEIARAEAERLAGNDWALWNNAAGFYAQRQGSNGAAKFHSWAEVALFLKAVQDAGRAPLVQSC